MKRHEEIEAMRDACTPETLGWLNGAAEHIYDEILAMDREALADEIAAAGENTEDWETASISELRARVAMVLSR